MGNKYMVTIALDKIVQRYSAETGADGKAAHSVVGETRFSTATLDDLTAQVVAHVIKVYSIGTEDDWFIDYEEGEQPRMTCAVIENDEGYASRDGGWLADYNCFVNVFQPVEFKLEGARLV